MIRHFAARHVGCLRDVQLPLTPLHALIGPNDSGKTTLLRAIGTLVGAASGALSSFADHWTQWTPDKTALEASVDAGSYSLQSRSQGEIQETFQRRDGSLDQRLRPLSSPQLGCLVDEFRQGVRFIHFDPKQLRKPSGLIPEDHLDTFFDSEGTGLPGIYQSILGRGDDSFHAIRDRLRELFPTVQGLRVPPVTAQQLSLAVELKDGTRVPASQMSEGLLYFLAYAALPQLAPASLLLLEEPENGLHPERIPVIIKILRGISESGTQVVMATHSPLVINELHPDEVTVVTRPSVEEGTKLTPIRQTSTAEA